MRTLRGVRARKAIEVGGELILRSELMN
jgi:hypothetical protein